MNYQRRRRNPYWKCTTLRAATAEGAASAIDRSAPWCQASLTFSRLAVEGTRRISLRRLAGNSSSLVFFFSSPSSGKVTDLAARLPRPLSVNDPGVKKAPDSTALSCTFQYKSMEDFDFTLVKDLNPNFISSKILHFPSCLVRCPIYFIYLPLVKKIKRDLLILCPHI